MTITPPRYDLGNVPRVARSRRVLSIVTYGALQGLGRGWTWLILVLAVLDITGTTLIVLGLFHPPDVDLGYLYNLVGTSTFWGLLVTLEAALVGGGVLADDISSGAISLYLSRPISLEDYLLAKGATVLVPTLVVASLPGILGLLLASLLGYVSGSLALSAALALVGECLLLALLLTALVALLSSLSRRRLVAAVSLLGVIVVLGIVTSVFAGTQVGSGVLYLSLFSDIAAAGAGIFGAPVNQAPYPGPAAAIVLGVVVVCALLTRVRISRLEVIRE